MLYTGTRLPEQPITLTTPSIRNIHFDNIRCLSGKSYGVEILGLPERSVEDVYFTGIDMNTKKGINISDAKGITLTNSSFTATSAPLFTITDGMNVKVDSLKLTGPEKQMLNVNGDRSANISISHTNIPDTEIAVIRGQGVSQEAVSIHP